MKKWTVTVTTTETYRGIEAETEDEAIDHVQDGLGNTDEVNDLIEAKEEE